MSGGYRGLVAGLVDQEEDHLVQLVGVHHRGSAGHDDLAALADSVARDIVCVPSVERDGDEGAILVWGRLRAV